MINAELESIEPWDASFSLQSVTPHADAPNRVNFSTMTRGDASSYLIKLNNTSRTTRVQLDLVETQESGGAPTIYRPHQRIPAVSYALELRDLNKGKVIHRDSVDHYTDTTVLRRVVDNGQRVVEFEFEDTGEVQGDYYFVRVTQANDAIAWSSPVWIGGYPKR